MGARQSKRSVDITTTPKKDGVPAEGGVVVGDAAAPGDGKLERIEEADAKPTSNGTGPHTDTDKDKEKDKDKVEVNEKESDKEDTKADEVKPETTAEVPAESGEVTTPSEGVPTSPDSATSPDSKETKKKDKKKKWSFRSISFSKKDKSKPVREDAPKNGDVAKEEPLAEGGEEAEAAVPAATSPTEEKSAVSSPATETAPVPVEAKEEEKAAPASPTPVEEKKEEPTPAPTPVPVEEKKEEIEKVEPVIAEKVENVAKPEAPAETPAEISTTESVDEAPACPAPAVPEEAPITPYQAPEPAITTDVASVTKAIEEIDISDKAVAAAVNEAIECANTNEIVTDSPHQNSINE